MRISKIDTDKKRYLELLLLADEQESMLDRYLERGWSLRIEELGGCPTISKEGLR